MMIVIHAPNVHQGGGKALLTALLKTGSALRVIVDQRFNPPSAEIERFLCCRVSPTVMGRLKAELLLTRLAKKGGLILCFGNLPPLFGVRGKVILFLQNRYLLASHQVLLDFTWQVRLRLLLERFWLRARIGRVGKVVVQSTTMADEVREKLGVEALVLPFMDAQAAFKISSDVDKKELTHDFLFVASPEPHKNHRALINAWVLLAKAGHRPSLALTIDKKTAPNLVCWIKDLVQTHQLRINMLGHVPVSEMHNLYANSRALIYPSKFESFGLPLLEADALGIPILASELDYVRDFVQPAQTFDPASPISISRAVQRFLNLENMKTPILTAEQFLDNLKKLI